MSRTVFPLISIPLAGVAIRYAAINRLNRGYIADRVSPYRNVASQLFRWYSSRINEAFTVYDTQVDRLGQVNEMTQGWDLTSDSTKDYGIRQPVPYADEAEAAAQGIPFALRSEAAQNVVNQIQLNREIRVSTFVNSTSSYLTGYYADKASAKWSDLVNSDPVADIKDAASKMLIRPNVGVCSRRVADILQRHPKVAVAMGGSQNSGMYYPMDQIARLLGLREIIVGDTLYQTSKRGQTLTTGNIWPDNFALHYQGGVGPDGVTSMEGAMSQSPDFLTSFRWAPNGQEWVTNEKPYLPGDMGLRGGIGVLAGQSVLERQVAPYAGYLFQNVTTPTP